MRVAISPACCHNPCAKPVAPGTSWPARLTVFCTQSNPVPHGPGQTRAGMHVRRRSVTETGQGLRTALPRRWFLPPPGRSRVTSFSSVYKTCYRPSGTARGTPRCARAPATGPHRCDGGGVSQFLATFPSRALRHEKRVQGVGEITAHKAVTCALEYIQVRAA